MIKINLLPTKTRKARKEVKFNFAIFLFLALALVIFIIIWFHTLITKEIDELKVKITNVEDKIKKSKEIITKLEVIKKDKKLLEEKLNVIKLLEKAKVGPVFILDELSNSVPKRLWLNSLQEKNQRITFEGAALNNEDIANFMNSLERSPYFKNTDLVISQQFLQGELKLNKFIINAIIDISGKKEEIKRDELKKK